MRSRLLLRHPVDSRNGYVYLVSVTERQARDEGANQTRQIMNAVKSARLAKQPPWSAQRLAEEMTKAGVPWNADVVVNLEHGRRKSLRVHELLALLFVLDVDKPLEVIVPDDGPLPGWFPVVPEVVTDAGKIRAWLRGERGPLRHALAEDREPGVLESAAQLFEQEGKPDQAASMRRLATLLTVPGDGADGQD